MLAELLTDAIVGPATLETWLEKAHLLQRHFFNSPRKRGQQSMRARLALP